MHWGSPVVKWQIIETVSLDYVMRVDHQSPFGWNCWAYERNNGVLRSHVFLHGVFYWSQTILQGDLPDELSSWVLSKLGWIFTGPDAELDGAPCLISYWHVHLSASSPGLWALRCALCCWYLWAGLHLFSAAFPLGWCSGAGSLAPLHLSLGVVLGTFHSWLAAGRLGRDLWSE